MFVSFNVEMVFIPQDVFSLISGGIKNTLAIMLLPLFIKLDFSDRGTNTHPSGKLPCHKNRCLNDPQQEEK